MDSFDDLLQAAVMAARAAAEIHHRRAHDITPEAWTEKGPADWVSEVDHQAEAAAVAEIRGRFPDHAIAAEESDWGGPAAGSAEVTWYIDPLDGTTNYLHGYPSHSVSIAALDADGPAVGVVINSANWDTFQAKRGSGAERNGEPITVSRVTIMKQALIGTGFPFKRTELLDEYLAQFKAILPQTSGIRRTGSAAIDLCDLACGRLDGFWELQLAPWDVAAGVVILREAGGIITDLAGGTDVVKHGGFVAGNPTIYETLRAILERTG
jgi:myo-inositol-1(or 4)-monophosphatase